MIPKHSSLWLEYAIGYLSLWLKQQRVGPVEPRNDLGPLGIIGLFHGLSWQSSWRFMATLSASDHDTVMAPPYGLSWHWATMAMPHGTAMVHGTAMGLYHISWVLMAVTPPFFHEAVCRSCITYHDGRL